MNKREKPPWTRSALAQKTGIGVETLRFYEQKKLLTKPARNSSGYRIYNKMDLDRLHFIKRSQGLGFSLQDIKHLLQFTENIRTPRKEVREFAETRLSIVRQKIRDLRAMERALGILVKQCDGHGTLNECPIVEFVLNGKTQSKRRLS